MLALSIIVTLAWAGPARDALDEGDRAWCAQDRQAARSAWKRAVSHADEPSVEAMGRMRLMLVSGSLSMAVHGPRADAALARCPIDDPWCTLAAADYALLTHEIGLRGDVGDAAALAREVAKALPGPALARRVWAGDAEASELSEVQRDGLGDGLIATDGAWPRGPGTWFVGIGAVGAPGVGFGGTVRFVHPDVSWQGSRVDVSATATSRGAGALAGQLETAGRWWLHTHAWTARSVVDTYSIETPENVQTTTIHQAVLAAAPGFRAGRWSLWLGPLARVDQTQSQGLVHGHGIFAGITTDLRVPNVRMRAALSGESALADYRHNEGTAQLRGAVGAGLSAFAFRALVRATPDSDAPFWRLPAVDGTTVLRGAPAGRYRDEWLATADLAWRPRFGPILGAALFGEAVWVDGLHPGGGAGLRLHLPPSRLNIVRVDVGWTDAGWGIVGGWGEAF